MSLCFGVCSVHTVVSSLARSQEFLMLSPDYPAFCAGLLGAGGSGRNLGVLEHPCLCGANSL